MYIFQQSLKDDEISKFALTNSKAPGDILNDVSNFMYCCNIN